MKGRRHPDRFADFAAFTWKKVKPGDYFTNRDGSWFVMSPSGNSGSVRAPGWTITEHDDKTITVAPSIWFDKDHNGWHGYLERGVWRLA